jgi:hypothetical protein
MPQPPPGDYGGYVRKSVIPRRRKCGAGDRHLDAEPTRTAEHTTGSQLIMVAMFTRLAALIVVGPFPDVFDFPYLAGKGDDVSGVADKVE